MNKQTHTPEIRTKEFTFRDHPKRQADVACYVCGKEVRNPHHRWVHAIDGGVRALHPHDEHKYVPNGGDCGLHPIGADCAKKFGIEWCV